MSIKKIQPWPEKTLEKNITRSTSRLRRKTPNKKRDENRLMDLNGGRPMLSTCRYLWLRVSGNISKSLGKVTTSPCSPNLCLPNTQSFFLYRIYFLLSFPLFLIIVTLGNRTPTGHSLCYGNQKRRNHLT